jgi:hypothetical protein
MFGVGGYGVVGWACNWVRAKMEREKRFRKKVEELIKIKGLFHKVCIDKIYVRRTHLWTVRIERQKR